MHVGLAEIEAAVARVFEEAGDNLPSGFGECSNGVVVQHPQVSAVVHHGDQEFIPVENAWIAGFARNVQACDLAGIQNVEIGTDGSAGAV